MKKAIFALVTAFFVSAAAAASAAWFSGEGEFALPHQMVMMAYDSAEACEADQGQWSEDLGCVFDVEDSVMVKREADAYQVQVSTITTNAHMCEFEGKGRFTNTGELLATAESEEWDDDAQEWKPATCELTVSYVDGDTVNVSDNGKCRSFCGMRATLDIAGAKRRTN